VNCDYGVLHLEWINARKLNETPLLVWTQQFGSVPKRFSFGNVSALVAFGKSVADNKFHSGELVFFFLFLAVGTVTS
jgi:hypothetical protein